MRLSLLLGCFLLPVINYFFGSAHMIPENTMSKALSKNFETDAPALLVVEIPKSTKKNKKSKKQKKNRLGVKNRGPPAHCIPLGDTCKSLDSLCCDLCAFCQCRLFRTVCFCRMGNPRC
ncbi:agouti signaling protein 1 [Pholidichthys leucotaenia]